MRETLGRKLLPLGDLAGLLQTRVQVEALIVQQPPQRHVGQLLHDLDPAFPLIKAFTSTFDSDMPVC